MRVQPGPPRRIEVPQPPEVDERQLVADTLFGSYGGNSDHAWAMGNRLVAGYKVGGGHQWSSRHQNSCGMCDMSVPIDEVAQTLQVHPHTLWRWWRRLTPTAPPRQPPLSSAQSESGLLNPLWDHLVGSSAHLVR